MLNTFERRLQHEIAHLTSESRKPERVHGEHVQPEHVHNELTHTIIGAAIEVHRHLGPGQLESVYERALAHELGLREIPHRRQVPISVCYKACSVGEFVADLIVDDKIIVELKSVAMIQPVHVAQTLSYLDATKLRIGLLINFNVPVLCRGVRRLIR